MAIRTVDLGGSDWSDGEVLYAVDLNDTFDEETRIVENITTGHDHDGSNSKQIGDAVLNGSVLNFNTSTGHDHDGTDSKIVQRAFVSSDVDTTERTTTSGSYVLKRTFVLTPNSSTNFITRIYGYYSYLSEENQLFVKIELLKDSTVIATDLFNTNPFDWLVHEYSFVSDELNEAQNGATYTLKVWMYSSSGVHTVRMKDHYFHIMYEDDAIQDDSKIVQS